MPFTSALGVDALVPAGLGFRNKIINGDFRVNQRAFSSNTTSQTFGFDRWYHEFSGGTCTYTPVSFTVGDPVLRGYEASQHARLVNSSQSATSHYYLFAQKIEDVRNGDGCTLTVSFYARAGSGTPSVAVELEQNFGSGGSTRVLTYVGKTAISTSWSRYSFQVTLPSISGKTIGTSSFLLLNLWVSAGSDYGSRTGSIGIQNGTFDFWGVQVEQNNVVTNFEQRPIGIELQLCQRYYERLTNSFYGIGHFYSTTNSYHHVQFNTPKRPGATPQFSTSALNTFVVYSSGAGLGVNAIGFELVGGNPQVNVVARCTIAGSITAGYSSLLYPQSSSAFIAVDCEL